MQIIKEVFWGFVFSKVAIFSRKRKHMFSYINNEFVLIAKTRQEY
jgi:hypothetical protein